MLTLGDVCCVTGQVVLAWIACIAVVVSVSLWYGAEE